MATFRIPLRSIIFGGVLLISAACTPDYPKCDNDEHCAEKGEFCVGQLCQQCREDSHCTVPGQVCTSNKCSYRLNYCDNNRPCPGNQKCRSNECGPQCLGNDECGNGQFCDAGSCAVKPECGPNADKAECDAGFECVSGRCEQRLTECKPSEPIYFAFDSSKVRRSESQKLTEVSECLKGDNVAEVRLVGHTDEEGDSSYNLALGQERADSVYKFLIRLGVPESLLSTVSVGENEPAVSGGGRQAKNRRVEF